MSGSSVLLCLIGDHPGVFFSLAFLVPESSPFPYLFQICQMGISISRYCLGSCVWFFLTDLDPLLCWVFKEFRDPAAAFTLGASLQSLCLNVFHGQISKLNIPLRMTAYQNICIILSFDSFVKVVIYPDFCFHPNWNSIWFEPFYLIFLFEYK